MWIGWNARLALLAALLGGCATSPPLLVVEGFSDLAVPAELDAIEVTVEVGGAAVATRRVDPSGLDLFEGARLAELGGLPRGAATLVARGWRGDALAGEFRTAVTITDRSLAVAVWLTRACRDAAFECPRPDDLASETACVGGECVDPRCAQRDAPDDCDEPTCAADAECPSRGECAAGVCRLGRCIERLDDERCGGGACGTDGRCVAAPSDAGLDAGPIDGGPIDGGCAGDEPEACGPACVACPDPANGTPVCVDGACGAECDPGFADCDRFPGCEARLLDPETCGGCDVRCEPPTGVCQRAGGAYTCASSCPPGTTLCGGSCEDLASSEAHCGACDDPCAPARATGRCASGSCEILACDPGWGDCDGLVANGCERRLNTLADCGACGAPCAPPGATGDCSAGTCAVGACDGDRLDCDGDVADGCECDPANATGGCAGAACEVADCDLGFVDCDSAPANGCEVDMRGAWDCASCASWPGCGGPHVERYACITATCVPTCAPGYEECVGGGERCETDTQTSVEHCGACDQRCATTLPAAWDPRFDGCTGGACTCGGAPACDSLQSCCEVRPDDFRCRNTDRNTDHCGACNTPCGTDETCSRGPGSRGQCCCGSACGPVGAGRFCTSGVCNPAASACE